MQKAEMMRLNPLEKIGIVALSAVAVVVIGAVFAPKTAAVAVSGGLAGIATKLIVYALS